MLKRITVFVFLLVAGLSQAQEGTVSPYSFYGIGTLKLKVPQRTGQWVVSVFIQTVYISVFKTRGSCWSTSCKLYCWSKP